MATWPATLPQEPMEQGYNEVAPDNILRTQMDVGPAKLRRRTLSNTRPVTISLRLSAAQIEILDAFYMTDLVSGSQTIQWVHPRTGVSKDLRFTAPPQYLESSDGWYTATCQLEVMP